jgi:heterodisulfide reductase subunit C2
MTTIYPQENDRRFSDEIMDNTGVNPALCWQCKCCSGGCPFSDFMDYKPNQILRLVQLGMKKEVLECATIWICVGCHTCSMECPTGIDMAALNDGLRQMARKEGFLPAEPDIMAFHKEVINSIHRHGRTHKLEIMLRYKLHKRNWLADFNVGLRMLSKRKLDIMPSKIQKIGEIKLLFEKSGEKGP